MSSRDGFAVEVQRPAPEVIVLRVEGELDLWTSLPFLDAILDAFSEHPELIAVDVNGVRSMDSTGLRVLVDGARHIEEGRVRFAVICRAGNPAARLLEQAGAQSAPDVHESVDDALGVWLDAAGERPRRLARFAAAGKRRRPRAAELGWSRCSHRRR